mmetsp:Transcript_15896/g.62111  ORF Transcript_15896/g.62111 Transcript_15896/m.62111 type:complete len:245 (+) Transcript_15896:654-1388(+)
MLVVHISVARAVRVQGLDPFNFIGVLRDVRLDRKVAALGNIAQLAHQLAGACGHEARGDHGLHKPLLLLASSHLLYVLHELHRVFDALRSALHVAVRRVAVHVDLAHHRALAKLSDDIDEQLRRSSANRGEVHSTRGSAAKQPLHYLLVHFPGLLLVTEEGFGREGVRLEPLEQGELVARACVAVLRRMDVRVNHARNEHLFGAESLDQRRFEIVLLLSCLHCRICICGQVHKKRDDSRLVDSK